MTDGPSKQTPEAEPLDDIILGDDEGARAVPPARVPSQRPLPDRPSAPPVQLSPPPRKSSSSRLRAAKMTLRIPDDEVSRPRFPSTPPMGMLATAPNQRTQTGPPPPGLFEPEDTSDADDTLELPQDELKRRVDAAVGGAAAKTDPPPGPAAGVRGDHEAGWTPFQPDVDDEPTRVGAIKPMPIVDVRAAEPTVLDAQESLRGASPISEEIPVEMDIDIPEPGEEITKPRLPSAHDSEDVKVEFEIRAAETGEFEIATEDVVSVESLPPHPTPPSVKTAGKYPAFQEPTATSLMAGVTPQPAAAAAAPAPEKPRPAAAQATTSQPARRQGGTPLVFVPPVGALAPPPMTETAAMRKKTRPWWEELFNDDFIRTMAKVTDGQIGKEVTFIEESLGCEAGAMILDLACGTGRHAVELAARGYQVVGFDLSLAMLARASDEAQDRKQKINFVQGDMREMTFEETFDGVYSWNTSFGYFDEEKNAAVVARVHKALKKGGQFLLDVVNRDYIVRQAPSLAWFEGDGCICMDEMTIDFITSRMKVKRTLMMDDGRTKEIEYSVRVYSLHELGKMLHDNGFRVAEVSGRTGTPGVFFGCEAPRTLILAEKR